MRRLIVIPVLLAALAIALAGAGAASASARRTVPPDRVLSNEWTFTRWAYTAAPTAVRSGPGDRYRTIAHLHWYTEDGFPEVYLLLRTHWIAPGQAWVELRVPARPNGQTGWVPRGTLGAFHLTHTAVLVNREKLVIRLFENGRLRWSAPVGVGAPGTPTPSGRFWIRESFKITDPASGYWPYAFGTADYSTLTDWPGGGVVGIHGPYGAQSLIPGHISHGCIRLRTWDDAWLAAHVTVGVPVRII